MGRITRIMPNNRVTIPVAELRKAALKAGDLVVIKPAGAGRITIVRTR